MSEWMPKTLGELLGEKGYIRGPFGSSLKRGEMKESGVPVYEQLHAIYNTREFRFYIDEKKFKELERFQVKTADLIISCSGTVGKISIIEENDPKGIISQALLILRPEVKNVRPIYLKYFLNSELGQYHLLSASHGSVQPNIAERKIVQQIPIDLPGVDEQDKIIEVLSSLDDKIDLLHRNNKTLEQLAETLFRQWFVEEAEDDCKKSTLAELVKVIDNRGKTPSFTETKTDYPIIEVNALNGKNRYIDYSLIKKYVDEHTYNNWFRAGHPKLNDILFSTVGSIGEMSMMLNPVGTIAQNIVALRAEKISPYYLYQYLMSIQDEIKEFDIGSVQPSIKVTHLIKIEIPIPDNNKVNLFDNHVKDICNKISVNYNQIQQIEILRDTLLPKLMSGMVRMEK